MSGTMPAGNPGVRLWLPVALTLAAWGCAEPERMDGTEAFEIGGHRYSSSRLVQLKLPKVLREASGLSLDTEDTLYTHDDERGIVYRIDYRAGRVLEALALEDDLRADFEGIAATRKHLYLVTSSGTIIEADLGTHPPGQERPLPFRRYRETLGCEVEGISPAPDAGALLVACKTLPKGPTAIRIHRWSLDSKAYDRAGTLSVAWTVLDEFFARHGMKAIETIQPTGITLTEVGHLLLVAGPQRLLLELTADGVPVAAAMLPGGRHRQPEGIALTGNGALLLVDEGDSRGDSRSRGRLSIYEAIR